MKELIHFHNNVQFLYPFKTSEKLIENIWATASYIMDGAVLKIY